MARVYYNPDSSNRVLLPKATGTGYAVPKGSFVCYNAGKTAVSWLGNAVGGDTYAITTPLLAFCPDGASEDDDSLSVIANRDAIIAIQPDANFARTHIATEIDVVLSGGTIQQADVGASVVDQLFVVDAAGLNDEVNVVGTQNEILVKINKPLLG